ncbi:unnamed protein product [Ectocarpus sp. CCAP 1310/34]|nr:unnamed protein product [Ectocarpus sp. CCAP 1310/34]
MITELMDRAHERHHHLRSTVHKGGKTEGDGEGKDASPIPESISGAAAENQVREQQEDQHDEVDTMGDGTDDGNSNSTSTSTSTSGNGNGNSDSDSDSDCRSNDKKGPVHTPDAFQFHSDFVLHVGDFLHGRLPNLAKTAMVYATSIDCFVVRATATGTPPGDLEDRTVDPASQTRRTLLEANTQRMSIVEGLQAEIMAETAEAEKETVEGRGLKKSKMVAVLGFLPFGKHGFRRRRPREHAAAHLGEATLSVTNKGDLEVSVDGSIVLGKSGPSWFGFRKKDFTYEVRVTEGVVMVSQGGHDWGIQARKL